MTAILPVSTYRLQFNRHLTFRDAIRLLPYLRALGVDAVYASPYLKAVPGSLHGYDVIDHRKLNPEIGSEDDHAEFCRGLSEHGLKQVLDIVPNHMAAHPDNPLWMDVLRHGEGSRYAHFFDIDWTPVKPELHHKVLLPVLGGPYGEVLDKGEIRLKQGQDGPAVHYGPLRLPLDPDTVQNGFGDVESLNGQPGQPATFERLHTLLERQHYRMADWRVASEEINYRRFFNINELAAIKTEEEDVFAHTHALVLRWVAEGKVHGLRIDHPDGLYEPEVYFQRLQSACAPGKDPAGRPFFIVVEKILDSAETLPADWMVHGTVGYEYLNLLNGLFVDSRNAAVMTRAYEDFIGHPIDLERLVHDAKRSFANRYMASELHMLGHRLNSLSEKDRYSRDYTLFDLTQAIKEIIACFPVYRTYIRRTGPVSERDAGFIRLAVAKAKRWNDDLNPQVFDFIERVLFSEEPAYRAFTMRFQQISSPVMAKGFEDTALYVDHRLLSLNEVGGDPAAFGIEPELFHRRNAERIERGECGLLAASTHDTKRSDDVRHRLNVLSEIPAEWGSQIALWSGMNERHKTLLEGMPTPRHNTEYFIYQTLLGCWPDPESSEMPADFPARLWRCVEKSLREAKIYTDWMRPDAAYEEAVRSFIDRLLDDEVFRASFLPLCRRVAGLGRLNSLSALVLRLASPGVFDIYQGDELWNLSLVDPDNRRPVDFEARRRILSGLPEPSESAVRALHATRSDGRIKVFLLRHGLELRRQMPELFDRGAHLPCAAAGTKATNFIGFVRSLGTDHVLAAAGRFFASFGEELVTGEAWKDQWLVLPAECAGGEWEDIYSTRRHRPRAQEGRLVLSLEEVFTCSSSTILRRRS